MRGSLLLVQGRESCCWGHLRLCQVQVFMSFTFLSWKLTRRFIPLYCGLLHQWLCCVSHSNWPKGEKSGWLIHEQNWTEI